MSSSTSRRGPYAKTAGRVDKILDVALELFAANGYRATTMSEIAERVGLSYPGLMHHFPTKEDVLAAVLRRRDERSSALAPEASRLPPFERLLTIADDMRADPAAVALHCVLIAEATAPDHPAHAYFTHRTAEIRDRLTSAMAELRQQGLLRPDADPASLAQMVLALLNGLQLQWLYHPDVVDIRAELGAFLAAWTP